MATDTMSIISSNRMKNLFQGDGPLLAVTVLIILIMSATIPGFATLDTLQDSVLAMVPLMILVVGLMFVLIVGAIDLSITSIIAMGSVVSASIMTSNGGYLADSGWAIPVAFASFWLVGIVIGTINGVLSSTLKMPSFMVTLGTFMFFGGLAVWYTSQHSISSSIAGLPPGFTFVGRGKMFGVSLSLMIALAIILAAWVLLSKSTYGRWLFSVGHNSVVAQTSGVPVKTTIAFAFIISAFCASTASIILTARLETGSPVLGSSILLDVIGAAVIGGVSLYGGIGRVSGAILGVIFLTVVDVGLRLLGLSLFAVFMIKGSVIVLAAAIDGLRHKILEG